MPSKTPTVLVVEDEELLLASIIKKLEKGNIRVMTTPSGEAALEYLKNTATPPDLIWLDYYLQGTMTGYDLMQKLHANPAWVKIPVIVVSNSAMREQVEKMLKMGAVKYFLKAEHLLSEIIDYINSVVCGTVPKKKSGSKKKKS